MAPMLRGDQHGTVAAAAGPQLRRTVSGGDVSANGPPGKLCLIVCRFLGLRQVDCP
jgi:hypothetical protein